MQVAVAGATGFVGRALVAELIGGGYDVVALSRHEARLPGAITRVVRRG